jgi:hypothetical protein
MDERLKIELSSRHHIYAKDVYLTWIVPGTINLIINNKYIKFDFEMNCFVLENKPIHCISIENQMQPCCVSAEAARGGWCMDCEDLGRFQSIVFTNNIILAQHRNTRPQGKVLGVIEANGIYSPEAKSFDDEENRFDCLRFETGGRVAQIWKVR